MKCILLFVCALSAVAQDAPPMPPIVPVRSTHERAMIRAKVVARQGLETSYNVKPLAWSYPTNIPPVNAKVKENTNATKVNTNITASPKGRASLVR